MSWLLLLLNIMVAVLPLILKWLGVQTALASSDVDWLKAQLSIYKESISKLDAVTLTAPQKKKLAKAKAVYAKLEAAAKEKGVKL